MKITSVNNDLVKETSKLLQKKYRDKSGLFILEGSKAVEEAFLCGLEIVRIFVREGYSDISKFSGIEIIETMEAVMSKITDTKTPPPIAAVVKQPLYNIEDLRNMNFVILLEGIKDAGNLGTILRTCAAFGIDGVILYGDTVDLYNPKCVRSATGNLWKTKVFNIKDFNTLKNYFANFEITATLPSGKNTVNLNDYKAPKKLLVMFGAEAEGLSSELKNFASKGITIKTKENVESLNLSISAGIVLYALRSGK